MAPRLDIQIRTPCRHTSNRTPPVVERTSIVRLVSRARAADNSCIHLSDCSVRKVRGRFTRWSPDCVYDFVHELTSSAYGRVDLLGSEPVREQPSPRPILIRSTQLASVFIRYLYGSRPSLIDQPSSAPEASSCSPASTRHPTMLGTP